MFLAKVGKRKSSNSSQIPKLHQFEEGREEGRDQGLFLKVSKGVGFNFDHETYSLRKRTFLQVLNEEDSCLDDCGGGGSGNGGSPAHPRMDALTLSAAASENALDAAGRPGSGAGLADGEDDDCYDGIELAMLGGEGGGGGGGPGAQAMLNLDSVKVRKACRHHSISRSTCCCDHLQSF